jgi:PAS domain S-box-containing protein
MTTTHRANVGLRSSRRAIRQGFPLAAPVMAALAMALFYLVETAAPDALPMIRFGAIVPVALASYRPNDRRRGLFYAAFFASAFLWQAAAATLSGAPAANLADALAVSILLFACSLVFSGVAGSFGLREALSDAVREREELLARTTSPAAVATFVRDEARSDLEATEAALLLYNQLESQWEIATAETTKPFVLPTGAEDLSIASWLAQEARPLVIDDIRSDARFSRDPGVRSLLARPLGDGASELFGILVLTHIQPGKFASEDLARLDALVSVTETALARAGAFARAGTALERLARRLGTIQRAGRELNASLEPGHIVEITLQAALELADAAAGAVTAELPGKAPVHAVTPAGLDEATGERIAAAANLAEPELQAAAPGTSGWLLAPVRRNERSLGAIAVQVTKREPADGQLGEAMATLAEHVAIALDNARLFAEVRDERQRSAQIIGNMAEGLLALDGEGRITDMNAAAEALTGWSAPEARNHPMCEVLGCMDDAPAAGQGNGHQDGDCGVVSALRERRTIQDERWPVQLRGGARRVFGLSAAPLPGTGMVVLIRDTTVQEEMGRFQRELIATFSHELRAPLANIDTIAQLLRSAGQQDDDHTVLQYADLLLGQTRRLSALAERTLDVSRLEAGTWPIERRPLAIASLVEEAIARWQVSAPDRRFTFDLAPAAAWAWADEEAVALVLDNLIDNALKYSPVDTDVTIASFAGPAGHITLAVQDRGPGIRSELASRLFQRFVRGDATDAQRVYGYGLGLYVARQLVEAMGGEIWVDSQPGSGSRFAFTLPLMPEDALENTDH